MNIAKNIYNKLIDKTDGISPFIELRKTAIAETVAIKKKKPIYDKIFWTEDQQKEFDVYWTSNYGRKIDNRWHKLYQTFSGEFDIQYIPEKIYTTEIEPRMNNYHYAKVLEDKSFIHSLAYDYCNTPNVLFTCKDGVIFSNSLKIIDKEDAVNKFLHYQNEVVLKPTIGSSSGRGLLFSRKNSDEILSLIKSGKLKNYEIQDVIKQHPALGSLNNSTINTIRITTYICNDYIYCCPLALRVGRENSRVDNIHSGGLVIGIDNCGKLLPYAYELGWGDKCNKFVVHPDNGCVFGDVVIPNVRDVVSAATSIHANYSRVGIISWDFSILENEKPILIESNIRGQGIWFPQIIHGKGVFGENTESILKMIRKR